MCAMRATANLFQNGGSMAIWVLRKYTPPAHTGEKSARKKRGVAFLGVVATSGGKRFGDLCSMHFSRVGKGVNAV